VATIGAWAATSVLCQWRLKHWPCAGVVRFIWAGADAVLLTTVLLAVDTLESPLPAGFLVLVAASGLWLRVAPVGFTIALPVAGYGALILDRYWERNWPEHLNWHIIFVAAPILTGPVGGSLVQRVRARSRFYDRRLLAQTGVTSAKPGKRQKAMSEANAG